MIKQYSKLAISIILVMLISSHQSLFAASYDTSSVFRFQMKMAERGNATSQFTLGLMYETGSGIQQSLLNATIWYKKAAAQHYKPASNRLTYLEIKKSGFKKKHEKWLKALKKDASYNEGDALFLLGQMYSEGTGVNKSLTRSLELLRKAAGGNIPGSEAEIFRVEAELSQLQQEYLSQEEKERLKPVTILPPPGNSNISTTIKPEKKSELPSPTRKKLTPAHPQPSTKKQVIKTQTVNVKQPVIKKTNQSGQKTGQTPKTIQKPVVKEKGNEKTNKHPANEHPIDTICSGRNRFSSGCR